MGDKSFITALLLILFLGLGAHFYVGKAGTGVLYLFTLGPFWYWNFNRFDYYNHRVIY